MPYKDSTVYNAYMSTYMLRRYYQRRKESIKLLGGKCVECGSTRNLQFDHVDPRTKTFSIAKMWSLNRELFNKEVRKCQLLCPKHHGNKSLKEACKIRAKGKHGTISSYKYCHCALCREAKAEYMRRYREAKSVRSSVGSST